MYSDPFDTLTRLGWALAAVVAVLLVLRAVRVEWRTARPARTPAVRWLDAGLTTAAAATMLAFLTVLGLLVYGAFTG